MAKDNFCGGRAFGIAIGITALVLLLAGGAGAATPISSCTMISSPGTYVLSQNIVNSNVSKCIEITSSDVVFDGAAYTIDGIDNASTYGIYVLNPITLTNVSVKNVKVTDWSYGIYYENTINGNIDNNTASSNSDGIFLSSSGSNTLTNNNVLNNYADIYHAGIYLHSSNNNTLSGNSASSNFNGIFLDSSSSNNKLISNNASSNYHGIYLHTSSNNTLSGNSARLNNGYGFYVISGSNNTLIGNNASNNAAGISLQFSSNNTLSGNNVTPYYDNGIYLLYSSNNMLSGNNASIYLQSSSNNTLSGNNASIYLYYSSNNTLISNNASNNDNGIGLSYSSNNTLKDNNVSLNKYIGISLWSSSNNSIYNNIFNNKNNYYFSGINNNTWNTTKIVSKNIISGSYSGGNFWANPGGTGFSQTCTDSNSDGICDSPYTLDSNNTDYLPLAYNEAFTPPITDPAESEVHVHKVNKLSLNNLSFNHNQLYDFDTLWTPNVWNVKNLNYVIFKISTPLNFTKIENYEEYQNGSEISSYIPYTHSGNDYIWNLSLVDHIGSNIDMYTNETNNTNPWADLTINKTQEGNNTRLNITFTRVISLGYHILTIRADQILSYTYPSSVFSAISGQHRIFFNSDTINQNQAYNFSVLVNNPEVVNLWMDNTNDWVEDPPSNDISFPVSGFGSINVSTNVPVKWSHIPVQPQYVQDIFINMSESTPTSTGGIPDTVGVYNNIGTWALWNTTTSAADIVGFGWSDTTPVVGDWNGDGKTEVGIYNKGGNNFLIKSATGFDVIGLGWAGVTPVIGDWNGDDRDEVGVYDNAGTWALWNSTTSSADIVGFGWANTTPVVGDWNGDGKTDVGIYNKGGNNFLIQSATGFDVIGLGWSGVTPVVGDWNGDGRDEVGVYNNAGTWALWNSTSSSADIVGFGWADTTPVVGDWNGDGKTDVGIYNKGGNNFFIKTESGATAIGLGWTGVTPVVGRWS